MARRATSPKAAHNYPVPKVTRDAQINDRWGGVKSGGITTLTVEDRKLAALEFRKMGYSEYDIGKSLGVTASRVSQMLKEALAEIREQQNIYAGDVLQLELERIDRMILSWYRSAKTDPRSADVLYKWVERRHKLLGLDITKQELTGAGGGPLRINASSIDITKLDDRMMANLEEIIRVGCAKLPGNMANAVLP